MAGSKRFAATILVTLCLLVKIASSEIGTIDFAPLPEKNDYKANDVQYNDGGMGPLFDFARNFINTALPGGFPVDFVNKTMSDLNNGSFDIMGVGMKLLKLFTGYVVAIGVGVVFIVIFPIVGCCFCVCRLCGNCGGKRHQEVTKNIHCKRRIFACSLFAISTFTLVGNICTYVSNNRMTVALDEIGNTVSNNLDDINEYLDLVQRQVEVLGIKNLQITRKSVLDNMNMTRLEDEISTYVLNSLSEGAFNKMEQNIASAVGAFEAVVNSTNDVHNAFNNFRRQCSLVPGMCLALQHDPLNSNSQFGDMMSTQKPKFDKFAKNSAVKQVKEQLATKVHKKLTSSASNLQKLTMKYERCHLEQFKGHMSKVDEPEEMIKHAHQDCILILLNQKSKIEDAFDNMNTQVHKVVQTIKEFRTNAKSGLDVETIKMKTRAYTKTAKTYDKYRHAGGAGLGAMITLVITLQMMGLAFGSIGQGKDNSPSQRGCVSNSAGDMLIASVAMMFLFASLLMLLTTISFSIGSILERFVCQPLSDPELQFLKVAENYFSTKDLFEADLPSAMRDCRDGKSAYTAFKLSSKFNISKVDDMLTEQKKKIDQELQTSLASVGNIGSISSFTSTASASLQDLHDALYGVNFANINQMILTSTSSIPLNAATTDYLVAMNSLKLAMGKLEKIKNSVDHWEAEFEAGLQKVSAGMAGKMSGLMDKFKNKIVGVADKFVKLTKSSIENDLGKCTPLWNLYNSILVVSVCKYTVDAFNGFWFSIGWCLFFFVPGIVIAVKLSKHYRRMDDDDEEGLHRDTSFAYDSPLFRSNKVASSDDTPITQY